MTVVAKCEKNSHDEVWVSIDDFYGRKIINMRVYYRSETGQWLPGKQGIALSVHRYPDFAKAVLQLGEILKAEGLLPSGKSMSTAAPDKSAAVSK
jgi:Transcriptional Coactivator p15 (PC4)